MQIGVNALSHVHRDSSDTSDSVATMHFHADGRVTDEDAPVALADMVGHYKRSKFLAEQEAVAAAQGRPAGHHPQPQRSRRVQ